MHTREFSGTWRRLPGIATGFERDVGDVLLSDGGGIVRQGSHNSCSIQLCGPREMFKHRAKEPITSLDQGLQG